MRRCTTPFLNERVSIKSIIRDRASRVRKHPFQLPTASFREASTGCATRRVARGDDKARVKRTDGAGEVKMELPGDREDRETIGGYYPGL